MHAHVLHYKPLQSSLWKYSFKIGLVIVHYKDLGYLLSGALHQNILRGLLKVTYIHTYIHTYCAYIHMIIIYVIPDVWR
jgi:hypothetical protein